MHVFRKNGTARGTSSGADCDPKLWVRPDKEEGPVFVPAASYSALDPWITDGRAWGLASHSTEAARPKVPEPFHASFLGSACQLSKRLIKNWQYAAAMLNIAAKKQP